VNPLQWLRRRSLPSEDADDYDGVLSYAAEWHAFSHGVYDGMRSLRARPGDLPENEDVEKEPHYYKGAYIIGTLLQAALAAALSVGSGVLPF
jgi:hypothetical protein